MKRIAVLLVLLLAARLAGAQQGLVVESFRLDPFDATAATTEHQVLDYNQNPCALIKVMIIDNTVNFKSDWIVQTDSRGKNEYWVYLCEGTRSFTVRSDFFLPTEVVFADYDPDIKGLKKLNTYVLTLSYKGEIEDGRVGVTFACNTPAAEYKIDGYATERNTNTFRIEPGEHKVEVTADGYRKLTTTIKVSPYLKRQEIALTLTPDQSLDALVAEGDRYFGEKNYTKALDLYRQAADKGNAKAQYIIGDMYFFGNGETPDYVQAFNWYSKAANQGDADAQFNLGVMYNDGLGVTKDYTQAVYWYSKSANQGNASAQFCLGISYEDGEGVTKDYTQAVYWYSKAANQGNANAQVNLGVKYYMGLGVPQDYTQAAYWYSKAADQGNDKGQYNLGMMYENGLGVQQDYTQAVSLYTKSANQGNAAAQNDLGVKYAQGLGVQQDLTQAFNWFSKAANQGDAVTQFNLGVMCENGLGVQQDYEQAVYWYRKAANQSHIEAQYSMGVMYENGWGVEKDMETAVKWYVAAAAQGSEAAIKALDRLQD
ncbi:MAG: SEL1-like repeat protein [Bacteroidales bacterium]|nr:SEL1-like repeat protein [Bacteroidales bacterium]